MTPDPKLAYLLRLPWTFVREATPEGDSILRITEIPSAVGTGGTPAELEADAWASLRASLEAYLHFGDPIPLPTGARLPWLSPQQPGPPPKFIVRQTLRYTSSIETGGAQGPIRA
jgi:hypothetical protein